jgi:hypothetical protein
MRRAAPFAVALALAAAVARADENSDLNLIPEEAQPGAAAPTAPPAAAPAPSAATGRAYLENTVDLSAIRSPLLVPAPPPPPEDWEERLFFDAREEWQLGDSLSADYSGRLNLRASDRLDIPSHENVRHDFREGYFAWAPLDGVFFDVGRINLKSGVAAGYNPTDFFKTHAVVEPISQDPAVLREDRLGTAMARASYVGEGASITAAFAPQFEHESPVFTYANLPSFDPTFGRTNAHPRFLLKGSFDLGADVAPELLLYREGADTRFGANLTRGIGQKIVAYAEWAGGRETSLVDQALGYGRATGTIPETAPSALPDNSQKSFRSDAAIGLSYATESNVTFNLEYHFAGDAFTHEDWRTWFAQGERLGGVPGVDNELWYVRAYALDIDQPISRQGAFLRFDWVDAFVPKLELQGFVTVDLFDGSEFAQLEADYYLTNLWTVGAIASTDLGTRHSDYGSLPQATNFLVKLARYF